MTESERLIEMIIKSVKGCSRYWARVIADYLLKNGILAPRYKLGQKVYFLDYTEIKKGEVVKVYYDGSFNNIAKYEIEYNGNVWGEDEVFLTREEAEKALDEQVRERKKL